MKIYFKVLAILLIPLIGVIAYAYHGDKFTIEFEKINFDELLTKYSPEEQESEVVWLDSVVTEPESTCDTVAVDTAKQRILMFGDSMVEFISLRMAQYCTVTGHELTYATWYSSTTDAWASDTLRHFVRLSNPTYVIICLGGNELYARDLDRREKNIRKMLDIIGNVPIVWICTPSWTTNDPFNEVPQRIFSKKQFYDSRKLTFERGSDHRHPTRKSCYAWMDSIAVWLQSQETAHPIVLNYPPDGTVGTAHRHVLSPPNSKKNKNNEPNNAQVEPAAAPKEQPVEAPQETQQPAVAPAPAAVPDTLGKH